MASKLFSFTKLIVFFIYGVLLKHYSFKHAPNPKVQMLHFSLAQTSSQLSHHTLIFHVEGALLKSSSLFPYFMLVAFEAGSLIRAFVLLVLYPLTILVSEEISIKIMVMICFFGIKKEKFTVGRVVLPKLFLEDVGVEGFEALRKGGRKVCVSDLPQVMIEGFLKDFLDIEFVGGRDLKVFCGYFVGLMEEKKNIHDHLMQIDEDEKICSNFIGFSDSKKLVDHHWFSHCKDIYVVGDGEKSKWKSLARRDYPKPLIFHDGRLAFRPTPINMLSMLMWFPFGLTLSIIRVIIAFSLPYGIALPLSMLTGIRLKVTKPKSINNTSKGLLYVCNHKTLMDPVMLSFGLKKSLTGTTYSASIVSEIISPIKTVRLTRNREADAKMMGKLLNNGVHLVICPEGTTCREPYLLRFSPLFAELSDDIIPVALDTKVTMFYGTSTGAFKCLDPFYFLMNPCPSYTIRCLDKVRGALSRDDGSAKLSLDVANYVQNKLGKTLEFECTKLTRKDKYLILAGNEGLVSPCTR